MAPPFWPPRARKTAETARFGPSAGKTESTAATPPKFRLFYPLEFFGLIHKRPGYDPFFAENPFSPADELVFMGLMVRSCHINVTACAEARRLAQKGRKWGFLVGVPFWTPRAQKTGKTTLFGQPTGKTELTPATAPKCWSFYLLELSD